jgi:hypothetical protein
LQTTFQPLAKTTYSSAEPLFVPFASSLPTDQAIEFIKIITHHFHSLHPALLPASTFDSNANFLSMCGKWRAWSQTWQQHYFGWVDGCLDIFKQRAEIVEKPSNVKMTSITVSEAAQKAFKRRVEVAIEAQTKLLEIFFLTSPQIAQFLSASANDESAWTSLIKKLVAETACSFDTAVMSLSCALSYTDSNTQWPCFSLGNDRKPQLSQSTPLNFTRIVNLFQRYLISNHPGPVRVMLTILRPFLACYHICPLIPDPEKSFEKESSVLSRTSDGDTVMTEAGETLAVATFQFLNSMTWNLKGYDPISLAFKIFMEIIPVVEGKKPSKPQNLAEWADAPTTSSSALELIAFVFDEIVKPHVLSSGSNKSYDQLGKITTLMSTLLNCVFLLPAEMRFEHWLVLLNQYEQVVIDANRKEPVQYLLSELNVVKELANSAAFLAVRHRKQVCLIVFSQFSLCFEIDHWFYCLSDSRPQRRYYNVVILLALWR